MPNAIFLLVYNGDHLLCNINLKKGVFYVRNSIVMSQSFKERVRAR